MYTGREGTVTEYGLGERVVLDLTEQYRGRGRGHRVFCDNYFTSPALFNELRRHQLFACGTIRQNRRGLPADLQSTRLREQILAKWTTCAGYMAGLHFLSTLSQPGECDSVTRRERDGSQVCLSCPTAILSCPMEGVDLGDQLRKYYSVRKKCIFWPIFDCCITNAYVTCLRGINQQYHSNRCDRTFIRWFSVISWQHVRFPMHGLPCFVTDSQWRRLLPVFPRLLACAADRFLV